MQDLNSSLNELSITPKELHDSLQKNEPLLLFDLRLREQYDKGHIKGAVHAVCDTRAKETIMPKIPKSVKIVLVDEDGSMSAETAKMMKSFGLDTHYLKGGIKNWDKELVTESFVSSIEPVDLLEKLQTEKIFLLDVRDPDEFNEFKIPGSVNIPLQDVFKPENISRIPKDKRVVTICPHGNRAMVATFALARNGIKSEPLLGGLTGWSQVLNDVKATENPDIFQVEKVGKGCLSYILTSNGEAIVIDPLYPSQKYQEIAQKEGFRITKVINTHQHADHISSARSLSQENNSKWYESGLEKWDLSANFLKDGDVISFGKSKLRVIHTPGHTPGSLSYVVDEKYVFTGDILFVESIGRPDLRDKAEEFAGDLYDSLHNKLLKLPPKTVVFPAHHGESVKPQNGIFSIAIEDAKKHEILKLSRAEFVKELVSITLPRPMNYQKIIQINKGTEPLVASEIPDLELGPNRCSVAGT